MILYLHNEWSNPKKGRKNPNQINFRYNDNILEI